MPTTDTNVSKVIVNKLTKAQYDSATKSATEFYAVTDADSGEAEVVGTTTGDYNYAWKFADGRLICFQKYTVNGVSTVTWGSCYMHIRGVSSNSNYAVAFISNPIVSYSFESKGSTYNTSWVVNTGGPSTTKPQEMYLVRPSSGNIDGYIYVVAYGFWK